MTTTREEKLETALKRLATAVCFGDGGALGIDMSKSPLGREILARMKFAETALSTPATEQQGYVDRYAPENLPKEADGWLRGLNEWGDKEPRLSRGDWTALKALLSAVACPAPQPAADTRVVKVEQLRDWINYTSEHGGAAKCLREIRAVIGEKSHD